MAPDSASSAPLDPARLEALLPPCLEAVREAAEAVLEVYRGAFAVRRKGDFTPVTEADLRSHRLLAARLVALPVAAGGPSGGGLPVISEEGELPPYAERQGWRRFWLVDPLDGTKEFVRRSGEFTINVALVEDRAPVLGVVYAPVADLLYCGGPALGAWRVEGLAAAAAREPGNARRWLEGARRLGTPPGEPLPLPREAGRTATRRLLRPAPPARERIRVLGSRSFSGFLFRRYVRHLRRLAGEVEIVLMGGSLKMCLVAEGWADLYPRFGPTCEWDTAAPHALLSATGRRVRRMDGGGELIYNKESLANPWFVAG